MRGRVKSGGRDARARIVTESDLIERVYTALRKKYGLTMKITDYISKLTGRYEKRAVIELETIWVN